MEKGIRYYLKRHGYNIDCVKHLDVNQVQQVYDLYVQNKEPAAILTGLHGYFGVYYYETKQINKMIECNKFQITHKNSDEGAISNLAKCLKEQNDNELTNSVLKYFNDNGMHHIVTRIKNAQNNYDNSNNVQIKPIKSNKPIVKINANANININTNPDNLDILINKYKISGNPSEIYDFYDKCVDNNIKKTYLNKLIILKNFVPSVCMVNDMLTLDSNNSSLELKLIKSIFGGCTVNNSFKNYDPNAMQNAINNNDMVEIHKLYEQCPNDIFKKMYLSKIMAIRDFKPSTIMVKDMLNLEFNEDVPLEIKVFKSIFDGSNIK